MKYFFPLLLIVIIANTSIAQNAQDYERIILECRTNHWSDKHQLKLDSLNIDSIDYLMGLLDNPKRLNLIKSELIMFISSKYNQFKDDLGEEKKIEIINKLISKTFSEDVRTFGANLSQLGRIKDPLIKNYFQTLLDHPNEEIRFTAKTGIYLQDKQKQEILNPTPTTISTPTTTPKLSTLSSAPHSLSNLNPNVNKTVSPAKDSSWMKWLALGAIIVLVIFWFKPKRTKSK